MTLAEVLCRAIGGIRDCEIRDVTREEITILATIFIVIENKTDLRTRVFTRERERFISARDFFRDRLSRKLTLVSACVLLKARVISGISVRLTKVTRLC